LVVLALLLLETVLWLLLDAVLRVGALMLAVLLFTGLLFGAVLADRCTALLVLLAWALPELFETDLFPVLLFISLLSIRFVRSTLDVPAILVLDRFTLRPEVLFWETRLVLATSLRAEVPLVRICLPSLLATVLFVRIPEVRLPRSSRATTLLSFR
jgi:hypothetical protein